MFGDDALLRKYCIRGAWIGILVGIPLSIGVDLLQALPDPRANTNVVTNPTNVVATGATYNSKAKRTSASMQLYRNGIHIQTHSMNTKGKRVKLKIVHNGQRSAEPNNWYSLMFVTWMLPRGKIVHQVVKSNISRHRVR